MACYDGDNNNSMHHVLLPGSDTGQECEKARNYVWIDVSRIGEPYADGRIRNGRIVCVWVYQELENRMRMDISGTGEPYADGRIRNRRIVCE